MLRDQSILTPISRVRTTTLASHHGLSQGQIIVSRIILHNVHHYIRLEYQPETGNLLVALPG